MGVTPEVYCSYTGRESASGNRQVVMSEDQLEILVKAAGLYIHEPEFGTGVVVIRRLQGPGRSTAVSKAKETAEAQLISDSGQ